MDYVPTATRADVLRILERDFHSEDRGEALRLLDDYDVAIDARGVARVHLAILKLSHGSIRGLREQIDVARSDPRDVISPAEYPEFDALGFVGISRLSPEEREALKLRDWQQYERWLAR
jgi:hypothetical protein